jgi:WD40 repeat protein
VIGVTILSLALLTLTVTGRGALAESRLADFTLSNDGRILAISRGGTIGLLDWRADKLVVLPRPAGVRSMGGPSFSPDDRSLAAVVDGDAGNIAIFDLTTLRVIQFHKSDCWFQSAPTFQPDGNAVLFSTGGFPKYLCLYDFSKRTTSIPLKRENGFYAIGSPMFVDDGKVLFVGVGPRNSSLASSVESLGVSNTSAFVPYHLAMGGMPEIVYPELVRRGAKLTKGIGSGPASFAASRNGERVVFIDRPLTEEDRVAREKAGRFRYDLFMIERGVTRQVTHLETYLAHLAMSYDGHTVAFGIQSESVSEFRDGFPGPGRLDLAIMDLRTDILTRIDLAARLDAEPLFAAKVK